MSGSAERIARAERLRDYFDLQLRFAQKISEVGQIPLTDAVALYTNFHRRFGLGSIKGESYATEWTRYTQGLVGLPAHAQMVSWTQAYFLQSPEETLPSEDCEFGCFSCSPSNDDGIVRIHFVPFLNKNNRGGVGPLNHAKVADRKRELRELFKYVRSAFPSARGVLGASWLYNLEAYRRLFPAEYGDSRMLPNVPLRLNGTSSWGQFLDHRECIKSDLRATFLQNLGKLDLDRPWRAFPLPVLFARAPIDVFYEFYGIAA